MDLRYELFQGAPNSNILNALLNIYDALFEDAQLEFFKDRMRTKKDLVTTLCYHEETLIGFKIGYRYDDNTLYSWVGGVLPKCRRQGVAQQLLMLQHTWALKQGYQKIRTKSMNRFKPMIILNLQNGFDIKKVYTNEHGQTKIIFEKLLS